MVTTIIITGYTPNYNYQEHNIIKSSKLYLSTATAYNEYAKKEIAVYNPNAFLGNTILDVVFTYWGKKVHSIDIFTQSGYTEQDAFIILNDGRRILLELKIRVDDSHIAFPLTCIGELKKYNSLINDARKLNAIPIIVWLHKDGSMNFFDLSKIDKPKEKIWVFCQKNNFTKEKDWVLFYKYEKKYSKPVQLVGYENILNYLLCEFNLNFSNEQ